MRIVTTQIHMRTVDVTYQMDVTSIYTYTYLCGIILEIYVLYTLYKEGTT